MSPNKRFRDDLTLIDELDNEVEDLYITSRFPPLNDVSGIVFSKRIMVAGKKVDVLCSDFIGEEDKSFDKLINNFISEKFLLGGDFAPNTIPEINYFRKEGLKRLNDSGKKYKRIVSRAWTIESHFLALDYKLQNPDVIWTAEFSDPIAYDMNCAFRGNRPYHLDDEFVKRLNELILNINKEQFGDNVDEYFPEVKSDEEVYYLVEYLPYLFADVVRYTNEIQCQVMLDLFPVDMKDFVLKKTEVSVHPTLDSEFYFLKSSSYDVDPKYLNFAYFGTYVGKRHLEYLFKSFEELKDEVKSKIKLHMFVPNPDVLKLNLNDLDMKDNIEIGNKLPFLEFLNLTTKIDVLIVNDTITEGAFDINPFLPSKVSDYLGSGNDIWYICEVNSCMDSKNGKYKSYVTDYESSRNMLEKIIHDKLGIDGIFDDVLDIEYYQNRLTNLNNVIHDLYGQRMYWFNQTQLYKGKTNELNSSLKRIKPMESKYGTLVEEMDAKDERIESLIKDCDSLIEDIHLKDDQINSLAIDASSKDDEISSLKKERDALNDNLRLKDEQISKLVAEVEDVKREISTFKSQMESDYLEKTKLKNDYDDLHKLTNESFELVQIKEDIIKDKDNELQFYRNHGNLFDRVISNPLSRVYIFFTSGSERKLDLDLFNALKDSDWFNVGFYLSENEDISRFKWVRLFSPYLHYVCHGFDEKRSPNREEKTDFTKKELLDKLLLMSENE